MLTFQAVFARTKDGLFLFSELRTLDGFVHAFSSRQHGPLEKDVDGRPQVASRGRALLKQLRVSPDRFTLLRQVHGDQIVCWPDEGAAVSPTADGILLTQSGYFAAIRTADCLPLLLIAPRLRRVCLLHAGWRGTRDRILSRGIRQLLVKGARAEELIVVLGPCIRRCCYEVGPEVLNDYHAAGYDVAACSDGQHLDLLAANRQQLEGFNIRLILDSEVCSACQADRFYSHRRCSDTGRCWAIAGFR